MISSIIKIPGFSRRKGVFEFLNDSTLVFPGRGFLNRVLYLSIVNVGD